MTKFKKFDLNKVPDSSSSSQGSNSVGEETRHEEDTVMEFSITHLKKPMTKFKKFDLNRVPDSSTSSEGSNSVGEQTHHEEEDVMECSSIHLNKLKNEDPYSVPCMHFGIINHFKNRTKSSRRDEAGSKVTAQRASTTEIIQLARAKFMQPCLETVKGFSFVGFSNEEIRDAELVKLLLASAEKVGQQQFKTASQFIKQCDLQSSRTGTSVQRLVHYFADALKAEVSKETGCRSTCNCCGPLKNMSDLKEAILTPTPGIASYYLKNPFYQVMSFVGAQIITEHVKEARKVHLISLEVYMVSVFIILMHDLASRPYQSIQHLKITAVGTKSKIKDAGERLNSLAQSLNLSFSFKAVVVEDLLELNKEVFELDDEEEVSVYSSFALSSLIRQPARLGSLMKTMRGINPCVTAITEIEFKHTPSPFINHFMECVLFGSGVFDRVANCMADDEQSRIFAESLYFDLYVRKILGAAGEEGKIAYQGIDMWRGSFAGFGMTEIGLSVACLEKANLLLRMLEHGSSCTLDMDGECLIIGWKGVPFSSLSAWKFSEFEEGNAFLCDGHVGI